jgi:geranylgeranylglycerol-phosphate geranylgeranyltransferase
MAQVSSSRRPTPLVLNSKRLALYWEFARPFTLVAPALGILSGGVTAFGAHPRESFSWVHVLNIALGTLMAAVLNAASNGLNQIYDLTNDRVNKPKRAIPAGRLSIPEAWVLSIVWFAVALLLALLVNLQCFLLAALATVFTWIYSAPPLRTKKRGLWANVTIAIPRGVLLKVAGWSTVKSVWGAEPWYIGLIFGLFLLGASTTKDYSDIEGDRADGCRTLPIIYGVKKSAWMIAPSFVIPFLLLPIGAATGILTGNPYFLTFLGIGLAVWGSYVCWLILRRPEELATTENHISWTHMYSMMFATQIGFMIAYIL